MLQFSNTFSQSFRQVFMRNDTFLVEALLWFLLRLSRSHGLIEVNIPLEI
jgi:hypothetical protein